MMIAPVREALRRLEGDGHLTRDPSGGMRPRVPGVRAMRDLYDVRLARGPGRAPGRRERIGEALAKMFEEPSGNGARAGTTE